MTAKLVARTPPQRAACERLPPRTSRIRSGMTGIMRPMPMASIITVSRMKRTWGRTRPAPSQRAATRRAKARAAAARLAHAEGRVEGALGQVGVVREGQAGERDALFQGLQAERLGLGLGLGPGHELGQGEGERLGVEEAQVALQRLVHLHRSRPIASAMARARVRAAARLRQSGGRAIHSANQAAPSRWCWWTAAAWSVARWPVKWCESARIAEGPTGFCF